MSAKVLILNRLDHDFKINEKLQKFIRTVESHIPVIPRYNEGDYYDLVAKVIRNVDGYCQNL